jgi:maleate cis-trans isomerase
MDEDLLGDEVVGIAKRFASANEDMAAILVECSNLPTFSARIQRETRLPVFDYITFMRFLHRSLVQSHYAGFL